MLQYVRIKTYNIIILRGSINTSVTFENLGLNAPLLI